MSMIRKPVVYFATERGRKLVNHLTTGAVMCITSAKLLSETIFIEKYLDIIHNYSKGSKAELSEKLKNRFAKCKELLDLHPVHKRTLNSFSVCGFDIYSKGSTRNKHGAFVGIPTNYEYETTEDIDKDNLLINLKRISWETPMAQQLAESLVLPEKLQVFAICREMLFLNSWRAYIESVIPGLAVIFVYIWTVSLNNKLQLFERAPILRYTMYMIVGTFGLGTFFFAKDFTRVHFETKSDEMLCNMGPEYMQNGIDFYDKLIKRNIALRHFMGKEGKEKYSALGNENFFIRYPKMPVVLRKQYCEEKLAEYNKAKLAEDEVDSNKVIAMQIA